MKKTLFSLLGGGLALVLLLQACGSDTPHVPPMPDGGSYVICEGTDAGVCAPGESCVYVERYERALCVRPCDATLGCEDTALLCCAGGADAGAGQYCMPREVCEAPDAGVADAGTNPGTDAGTNPGTDAGTNPGTDGGTNPGTDGGTNPDTDGGTNPGTDAGTSVDAGTGTDAGFPSDAGTDGGTPPPTFATIRIMASNLTSGNNQSYDLGHGTRLMQGVTPDIILIQEFDYGNNSVATIRQYVTDNFGASFQYYRESQASDGIPNGIISRFPIITSGEWTDNNVPDRDYAWARIDIPGPKDLWAVSVHLWSGGGAGGRNSQANELVNYIRANVPDGDYLVIGGDYNTDNHTESCLSTLSQVVAYSSAGPHPADHNNNTGTNASRAKPYDRVLADGDLNAYRVPTVIGSRTFPNGLVLDSRVYTPLSEIAPVQLGDSSATNMQHMGVVRDFRVPAN